MSWHLLQSGLELETLSLGLFPRNGQDAGGFWSWAYAGLGSALWVQGWPRLPMYPGHTRSYPGPIHLPGGAVLLAGLMGGLLGPYSQAVLGLHLLFGPGPWDACCPLHPRCGLPE